MGRGFRGGGGRGLEGGVEDILHCCFQCLIVYDISRVFDVIIFGNNRGLFTCLNRPY